MTLYLADEQSLRDVLGAAWLTVALCFHVARLKQHNPSLVPQRNRGVTRGSDPRATAKNGPKPTCPPYGSIVVSMHP